MSRNRGYRDDWSNYQMNNYGGRSGNQMMLSPWEGGIAPGAVRSGGGHHPTQTSSLVSELSSPDTQMVLGSLLSSLLRSEQQQVHKVPPLLSLGYGNVGGNSFQNLDVSNVGGNYYQEGYDQWRFRDRDQNRRLLDQRRSDYGKGRQIASSKGGAGYRSPHVGKRSASGSKVGSNGDKKDDAQTDKDKDKANRQKEDTKRKDDKEDEDDDEKEEDGDVDGKGTRKSKKSSRYHGIPDHFFFCHVCMKHMWDDQSFENHLKGRTHLSMMDMLDNSYRIKVEFMRHEMKVEEQRQEIEMERIKRLGRKVNVKLQEYCTMCDLHFYGSISKHRKNKFHQQLKSFLHPKCSPCGKEFTSHIELDYHKLTPLHLRNAAESQKKREDDFDEFDIEDLIGIGNGDLFAKNELKVKTMKEEKKDVHAVKKSVKDAEKDEEVNKEDAIEDGTEQSEKVEAKPEGEAVDDPSSSRSLENVRIPKYNPDVPYATNLVKKITGFHCRVCRRFHVNKEDSEMHCRTMTHYNNTVTLLKMKQQKIPPKHQERRKDNKEIKRSADEKMDDDENWKRCRVSKDKDDTQVFDSSKGDEEMVMSEKKKSDTVASGKDKCDPFEADAKAEAVENNDSKLKTDEEKMWSEFDRDLGSILDAVVEDSEDDEMAKEKQPCREQEAKDEKTSPPASSDSTALNSGCGSLARGSAQKRD